MAENSYEGIICNDCGSEVCQTCGCCYYKCCEICNCPSVEREEN